MQLYRVLFRIPVWVSALMVGSGVARGQNATVTFYSHGSMLTSGMPGGNDIFEGRVFDGDQSLFTFHDSYFAHNNRFLTLSLPAGDHLFGATYGKKPKQKETLAVTLKAGQSYVIWAGGNTVGVPGVYLVSYGRLEMVSCADAEEDLNKAKQLKQKAYSKYLSGPRASMFFAGRNRRPARRHNPRG